MTTQAIRVGIVGLSAEGRWAATAHVPAIAAVDGLEVRGLTASTPASSRASAEAHGGVLAFESVDELAASDEIDLVVVSVKVPAHYRLLIPALAAGKPVFSEWPLAASLAEADELVRAAGAVRTFVGLQNRSSVIVRYVRDLVEEGYVGQVLSTTLVAAGGLGGPTGSKAASYLLDRAMGATMLTIPFGHTLDAMTFALGEIADLKATTAVLLPQVRDSDTGELLPKSAEDQVAVVGSLARGAVFTIHYRGGTSPATPFLWEIQGTEGHLQVTAGGSTLTQGATLRGSQGGAPLEVLQPPAEYDSYPALAGTPAHAVAHSYRQILEDLRSGSTVSPDFALARDRHRLLDRIQRDGGTPLPSPTQP